MMVDFCFSCQHSLAYKWTMPRRSPKQSNRPRRSDSTRAAILKAARERFASDGYDRATIRSIAADARIDPSMVMRYFGSKERLFAIAANFDLNLPDMSKLSRSDLGNRLVRHFLERWEGNRTDDTLQVLLRSALTNEFAADRMRTIFSNQIVPAFATIFPIEEAKLRGSLVASQILGLALGRYILRFAPIATMDHQTLISVLAPTIQRYLTEDLRTGAQ
jgi:AcrR family transcriptional regulator